MRKICIKCLLNIFRSLRWLLFFLNLCIFFFFHSHKLLHPIDWWSNVLCLQECIDAEIHWFVRFCFIFVNILCVYVTCNAIESSVVFSLPIYIACIELQKTHINNNVRLFAILFIFNGFTCLFFPYKSKSFSLLLVCLHHIYIKTVISSILWPSDRSTDQPKIQSACIWNCNFMKAVNLKRDLYFFLFCACELNAEKKKKKRERISLNELCAN